MIDRWTAGESGIADGLGACVDFEPEDHLTRKQARRADRFSQFALVACNQAIAQSGIVADEPYSLDEVGANESQQYITTAVQNRANLQKKEEQRP